MDAKQKLVSQIKRYPLLVAAVISIILALVANTLRSDIIPTAEETRSDLEDDSRKIARNIAAAKSLEEDLEKLKALNEQITPRLIDATERADNIELFYKLNEVSEASVSGVNQLSAGSNLFDESSPNTIKKVNVIPFRLNLVGSYQDTIKVLEALTKTDYFLRLSGFSLSGNEQNLTSEISLFVLAQKQ